MASLTTQQGPSPRRAGPQCSTPAAGSDSRDTASRPRVPEGAGAPAAAPVPLFLAVLVGATLLAALALRFWTRSDLWLDEAQTVNISRLPITQIPGALRHDGAPPLFYVLLHYWMAAFGRSDVVVRALPGVLSVATLPLVWLAGRRLSGPKVAWAAVLIVATSPFAIAYATDARMYSLVVLLDVAGLLSMLAVLARPRPANVAALAAVTGLLLYSHYWAFYLVFVVGSWLLWRMWRERGTSGVRGPRAAFGALCAGAVTFVPWAPIFLFQLHHTGTPWAAPASFSAMVHALAGFAGGSSSQGRALALMFFALALVGLFGAGIDDRRIELDIRTRPGARPLAVIGLGTLFVAIVAGFVSHSAFSERYTAIAFVPIVLLVAWGTGAFRSDAIRRGVLAAMVVFGLAGAVPNIWTNRTQSGQVAAAISKGASPGDVVAYCPDQLGPPTSRLLPAGLDQVTFPRRTPPEIVNWVDYAKVNEAASPAAFVRFIEGSAGAARRIFYVWAPGYNTYGSDCEQIASALQADPSYQARQMVAARPQTFYEPMYLWRLTPSPRA